MVPFQDNCATIEKLCDPQNETNNIALLYLPDNTAYRQKRTTYFLCNILSQTSNQAYRGLTKRKVNERNA